MSSMPGPFRGFLTEFEDGLPPASYWFARNAGHGVDPLTYAWRTSTSAEALLSALSAIRPESLDDAYDALPALPHHPHAALEANGVTECVVCADAIRRAAGAPLTLAEAREAARGQRARRIWDDCAAAGGRLRLAVVAGIDRRRIVQAAATCARRVLPHLPASASAAHRAVELAEAWARGAPVVYDSLRAADAALRAAVPRGAPGELAVSALLMLIDAVHVTVRGQLGFAPSVDSVIYYCCAVVGQAPRPMRGRASPGLDFSEDDACAAIVTALVRPLPWEEAAPK